VFANVGDLGSFLPFGMREMLGISLAISAVVVMSQE
jgi:hypothetical protein